MMRKTVIIGFAEALSGPEALYSLYDCGYQVYAFSRKGKIYSLQYSKYVKCYKITSPSNNVENAKKDLEQLIDKVEQQVSDEEICILPLDDTALWLCNKIRKKSHWIICGSTNENYTLSMDKYKQVMEAESAGFKVPFTKLLNNKSDCDELDIEFPVILKPNDCITEVDNKAFNGSSWICANEYEFESALSKWSENERLIMQSYKNGNGEGVFGISIDQKISKISSHKRVRMMNPHGSGSSACKSQKIPEQLIPPIKKFIANTNYNGIFMFEFLKDLNSSYWFMELNGRPWGSMALARRQGLEYPAMNVNLFSNSHISLKIDEKITEGMTCRHLGRELMHPLFVIRGPKSSAIKSWPNFLKVIPELLIKKKDKFYNWRTDDLKVFIFDTLYTIRDQIFK